MKSNGVETADAIITALGRTRSCKCPGCGLCVECAGSSIVLITAPFFPGNGAFGQRLIWRQALVPKPITYLKYFNTCAFCFFTTFPIFIKGITGSRKVKPGIVVHDIKPGLRKNWSSKNDECS